MNGLTVQRFKTGSRFLVAAFLLALTLLAAFSQARADSDALLLTGLESPPYLHKGDDGNPTGLLVELLREVSSQTGIAVEFAITNWPRAQLETRHGRADLIFPVVHTPERETWLDYPSSPIATFEMMIFARKDTELMFSGKPEDLFGLRIGKIASGRMHPKFRALEESGRAIVDPRDNLEQLIKAVHHGRIDVFVAPRLMTLWTAKKMKIETVEPFKTPIGVSNVFLAFSKSSPKRAAWDKLRTALPSLEFKKALFLASLEGK